MKALLLDCAAGGFKIPIFQMTCPRTPIRTWNIILVAHISQKFISDDHGAAGPPPQKDEKNTCSQNLIGI